MSKPRRLPQVLTILGTVAALQFSFGPSSAGLTPASAEPWLHVKVVETDPDAETVHVNVPLSLVEALMPILDHAHAGDSDADDGDRVTRHHHHGININSHDLTPAEMHAILEAFRRAEDGEYVTVDGVDEKVRVTKSDGCFLVDVDDRGAAHEQVRVKMRMDVLDALLSGGKDELNFQAAARSLRSHTGEDLVTVTSDDETVRIWIDERKTAD
jgi:hypothetical protein